MGILCHKVVPESSKQKGRLFTTAFGFAVNDDDENNDDKNYHGTTSMVAPLGGRTWDNFGVTFYTMSFQEKEKVRE